MDFSGRQASNFLVAGSTTDEILSVWHFLAAYDLFLHADSTGEWFDIHAVYGTDGRR